ncbi:DUF551 domain-containing protein [Enterobacter hormaechei]|nr:DUF551 domain-containing protein [Enterobacter hormaechei]
MSTITKEFTKEQLIEKLKHRISVASGFPDSEKAQMDLELARIALASLEAEPVAWISERNLKNLGKSYSVYVKHEPVMVRPIPLYTTPPAPVSVPDEIRLLQSEVTIWKDRWELLRELFREVADALGCDVKDNQAMLDKIEMLQGAEPVSNRDELPDGWVACSERMPEEGDDMIVFTDDIVMSGVSYSKKKGFYLQALGYDDDEPVDNVTHWMPLPAAPQQEAKNV